MNSTRQDRIRERALALWHEEGQPADRAEEHWLQAEREIGTDGVEAETEAPAAGPDETVETVDMENPDLGTLIQPDPDAVVLKD